MSVLCHRTFPATEVREFLMYRARHRDGTVVAFRRADRALVVPLLGDVGDAINELHDLGLLSFASVRRLDTVPGRTSPSDATSFRLTDKGLDAAAALAASWDEDREALRGEELEVLERAAAARAHRGERLVLHAATAGSRDRLEIDGEAIAVETPSDVVARLERMGLVRLARPYLDGRPRPYRLSLKGLALCGTPPP